MALTPIIAGQGAIATLMAARAYQHQLDYQVLTRHGQPKAMSCLLPDDSTPWPLPAPPKAKFDPSSVLFLPLKAFDILACLRALDLPTNLPVVLLNNGMLDSHALTSLLPTQPLLAATTSHGAYKPAPTICQQTGVGQTRAGWLANIDTTLQRPIEQLLETMLGPCHWQQNMPYALWLKLAVNSVINPLTAIHNLRNGELAKAQFTALITQLCEETAAVMQAAGFQADEALLRQEVEDVIDATARNYSSMHQDIAAGRRSEIDAINGYIVSQGQHFGVATPCHRALWHKVRQLSDGDDKPAH